MIVTCELLSTRLGYKTNDFVRAYNGPPLDHRPLTEIERSTMAFIRDRQLNAALTILYFGVESGRQQLKRGEDPSIRRAYGTALFNRR